MVGWREPVHPLGGGELDGVNVLPRPLVTDQLGLVQGVQSLGQGVVIGVARPHRGDRLALGQGLPVADGPVLHPAVGVMHQARQLGSLTFSLPDGHSQGVQGQVGAQAGGGLSAHDSPREDIGDEGDVDPYREGAYVGGGASRLRGNVGDSQLVRPESVEMPFDETGWALLSRCAARGARGLGAADAVQAQVAHEPLDGTPGHVTGTVTPGALRSAPHHVRPMGPPAPATRL